MQGTCQKGCATDWSNSPKIVFLAHEQICNAGMEPAKDSVTSNPNPEP